MQHIIPQTAEEIALRIFILLAALALDWLVGEPDILWRRLPHPVVLFGRAISFLDKGWNRRIAVTGRARLRRGLATIFILILVAGVIGYGLSLVGGWYAELIMAAILLSGRSLDDHIRAVSAALDDNLDAARDAVSMIVGRTTTDMSAEDISRAAIETGAENLSDGVIAPAFWFLMLGLPGLLIYKMTNTADSMIGYKNAKYRAFGWAAARLDDLLNYLPARLTAAFIILASFGAKGGMAKAVQVMRRDASTHASPNAGWPEAAMAGGLDVKLAGPRTYGHRIRQAPYLNAGGQVATRHHILQSLHILKGAQLLGAALLGLLLVITY